MDSQLTEFSFGFGFTQQYLDLSPDPLIAAPFFPTLSAEAQLGYDIRLDFGYPVFFQFKLTEYMVGNAAGQSNDLAPPYYRFWLMPRWKSRQHNLLVNLNNSGQAVYYVAPWFWTQATFNQLYLDNQVPYQCAFVQPSAIGEIQDDDNHCVFFNDDGAFWASTPKKIRIHHGDSVFDTIRKRLRKRPPVRIESILMSVESVLSRRDINVSEAKQGTSRRLEGLTSATNAPLSESTRNALQGLEYISYLSHAYFQAEFLFYPSAAVPTEE